MTNEQLYMVVGLPLFAVIVNMIVMSLLLKWLREDLYGIRGEIRQMRSDVDNLRREIEALPSTRTKEGSK
jgi:cell division protein FtsL